MYKRDAIQGPRYITLVKLHLREGEARPHRSSGIHLSSPTVWGCPPASQRLKQEWMEGRAKSPNPKNGPPSQGVNWPGVESPSAQYFWGLPHRVRVCAVVVDNLSLDTGFLITLEFVSTMTKHIPEEGEKRSGLYKDLLGQPLLPRAGVNTVALVIGCTSA